MSRLNQEYFNAKKKHEENVSPKAWLKVILLIMVLVTVLFWTTKKSNKVDREEVDEELQNIDKRINESSKTQRQTRVFLENLGLSVELHEGLKYDYSEQVNMLTAISQDSNELAYSIGEVPLNMQTSNMKELWINSLKEEDVNLTFIDSLDLTIVETVQNGMEYKGILTFKELDNRKLVIQSVSLKSGFKELEPRMNKVIESIQIESTLHNRVR